MNTPINKIEFINGYPHVLVKVYRSSNYSYDESKYCKTLDDVNKFVASMIKKYGVACIIPVRPQNKAKMDFHEKARIDQFMMETNSTPVKQTPAFKAKVLGRAEKCSDTKKLSFAQTLRWYGMERLAESVEEMVWY